MMDAYGSLPSSHVFEDFWAHTRGNTLYGTGDELSTLAVLSLTDEADHALAITQIMDAAVRASGAFADMVQGWFLYFMWTHCRESVEEALASGIVVEAPDLMDVYLPFLTSEPA